MVDDQTNNDFDQDDDQLDDDGSSLGVDASVLDLFSQFQVLKVENLILGGSFGPGSSFGKDSRVQATTIAGRVNNVFDIQDAAQYPTNTRGSYQQFDVFASSESTKEWFFSIRDSKVETFVITISIFGGNSSRFITAASDILHEYLIPKNDPDDEPKPVRSLFDDDHPSLIDQSMAVRDQTYFNTASGKTSVEIIRFRDDRAQSRMLGLICSEYKFLRIYDKITDWLREFIEVSNSTLKRLGSFEPELARTQASLAVGVLAKREYKHYLDQVIQRWALSRDAMLRFNVGWALLGLISHIEPPDTPSEKNQQNDKTQNSPIVGRRTVNVWDKVFGEEDNVHDESVFEHNVTSLLKHWISLNNPYLQWTAVMSLSRVGLIDIDQYWGVLLSAAKSRFPAVRGAAQITVGLLYLTGSTYARSIIIQLAKWSESENELLRDFACRQFLILVQGRFDEEDDPTKPTGKQGSTRRRTLNLWDLLGTEDQKDDTIIFDATCTLLNQSLNHQNGRFVDKVNNAIVQWLNNTDKSSNDDAKQALIRLFIQVSDHDVESKRQIAYALTYPQLDENSIATHLKGQI